MAAIAEAPRDHLRSVVDRLRPVIERHREEGERERRLADAVVLAMREDGLLRLWAPREFGGDEISVPSFMETVESISRVDAAAGWTFANLATGAVLAAFLPETGAREIYADGPDVAVPGSIAPRGRADPVSGGYELTGRWPLASGCAHGDWLAAVALIFDGDTPRVGPGGAPDLQVMFFRREECEILDTWNSVGLRGTGSTDFTVERLFVPERRVFALFTALPGVSGPLYRAGIMVLFSMALSSVLLGIARAAIDAFVELAKAKTPTLSQAGLASRPTIHAEVARSEALVQSARAFLYQVADEIMATVQASSALPDKLEASRRLACVNAGVASVEVVDRMFALAGATPVYSGHPLERCLRDVHTASQHLVMSPVWWEKTGQYYLGFALGMP
jgi:indole-3-acetate monooxygenase